MVCLQSNCVNNFKVENRKSKGDYKRNIGTSGLPKVGNDYGNRGIVVPVGYKNNLYGFHNRK